MASNMELDRYLKDKIKGFQMIPSQSYEGVFTPSGKWKPRILSQLGVGNVIDPRKPWFVILNMDSWFGPGNHWVLLVNAGVGEPLFYYDPLLPNKHYEMPLPLRRFVEEQQEASKQLVTNWDADQGSTVISAGERIPDEMCGAYCCVMLETIAGQKSNPTEAFYNAKMTDVRRVFRELLQSGV